MKKFFLIFGVLFVAVVLLARIMGNYIFKRPGGLSGKPKEISAQAAFLPIINQCPNVHPDQLNMNVTHAALLGYRDPEWLFMLNIPAANIGDLKTALSSCYQREDIRNQKRTIRLKEPLYPLPEQSRTTWWEAQKVNNPDIWSFYLDSHMEVQLVFEPEKNLVYARMFSW
jgi:hypothetical protein